MSKSKASAARKNSLTCHKEQTLKEPDSNKEPILPWANILNINVLSISKNKTAVTDAETQ